MKRFFALPLLFLLQGCLYFNDTGVSSHLYDNCKEYYDNCGIYHKECPPNLVDYHDVTEGIKNAGSAIKKSITGTESTNGTAEDNTKECIEPATVTY